MKCRAWLAKLRVAPNASSVICWMLAVHFPTSQTIAAEGRSISTNASLPTLTNAQQVLALGVAGARTNPHPVDFVAVVTLPPFTPSRNLWVQDGSNALRVTRTNGFGPEKPGQRVRVRGMVSPGRFKASITAALVEAQNGDGPLPEPLRLPIPKLFRAGFDGRWMELEGVVHDVVLDPNVTRAMLYSSGYHVNVRLPPMPVQNLPVHWLDTRVRLRGICGIDANNFNQPAGFTLLVPHTNFMTYLSPPGVDPFAQPVHLSNDPELLQPSDRRVKVRGTVVHHSESGAIILRDKAGALALLRLNPLPATDSRSIRISRPSRESYQPGEMLEAVGRPTKEPFSPQLIDADVRRVGRGAAPAPLPITVRQALSGRHDMDLVTLEARLVGNQVLTNSGGRHEILMLQRRGVPFQAMWQTDAVRTLPPLLENSLIRVQGMCRTRPASPVTIASFTVWLRSPEDVTVLGKAPFWMFLPADRVLGVGGGLSALAIVWIWLLRRQVRQRTRAEEKARRSEATTRTINYFATSLLERHDEEDILWDLAKNCVSQLGFVDCVIYLLDPEWQILVQRAAFGPKNPEGRKILDPITIPLGQGIVGCAAKSGKAELIPDTRRDQRYICDDEFRLSELAVPMVANGQVLGVIDSEHPRENFFTQEHLEILTAIASLCTNKLIRARAEQKLLALNTDLERRVTERTDELRESEAKFRALYESASTAVILHDERGFIDCNPATLRIFGYSSRDQLLGKHPGDVSPPVQPDGEDSVKAAKRHIDEALAKGAHQFEWLSKRGDGTPIPIEVVLTPVRLNGRTVIQALVQDITERKRAEAELQRSLAQEKELSELKSRFVSMVSHEFRTPLGIIMSSAEILRDYLDRLTPERRAEHLHDIAQCARHMGGMMEDVLLLSRVEAGRVQCRPAPLDLAAFCQRLVDEISSSTDRRCPIILSSPVGAAEARADEGLLRHIFTNLLSNAVKYSPAGSPVDFLVAIRGDQAVFTVRDRGIGIPEADRPQLFQAFYRGGNVGETPGTGLGLIIVKHCVELHGGKITFESHEDAGTSFVVVLPLFCSVITGSGEHTPPTSPSSNASNLSLSLSSL